MFALSATKNAKYTVSYIVNSIDLTIETDKNRKIPENAIGAVDHSLFNSRQLRSLDNFTRRYEKIADSAFERWVDVLRWKTGIGTICAYHENKQKSHWGTYLHDASTNKPFYCPPHRFTVKWRKPISKRDWRLAQICLEHKTDVPIWHLYIAEACQKRDIDDVRGFILDLAISVEIVVRTVVKTYITNCASSDFEEAVGRIGIGQIIGKWADINRKNRRWKNLKSEIRLVKLVIDERNGIMHRGVKPRISESRENEILMAVCKFIDACEDQLHAT